MTFVSALEVHSGVDLEFKKRGLVQFPNFKYNILGRIKIDIVKIVCIKTL